MALQYLEPVLHSPLPQRKRPTNFYFFKEKSLISLEIGKMFLPEKIHLKIFLSNKENLHFAQDLYLEMLIPTCLPVVLSKVSLCLSFKTNMFEQLQ